MELEALLNYPRALPAMSRTVSDLLAEMNKDDPSPKRVADLVSRDPALTTRVLRLSNSAFFRVSRQIGNAEEAVALLGMTHVRSLVMAAALGSSFKNVPGVDMVQFWRYSLRVADISRSLASLLRQNEGNAFTAGLVHAIGDLIMHIAMPDVIGPIDMGTPPGVISVFWESSTKSQNDPKPARRVQPTSSDSNGSASSSWCSAIHN